MTDTGVENVRLTFSISSFVYVQEFFQAICELIRLSSLTEATYE